jgi:hypothetical protein
LYGLLFEMDRHTRYMGLLALYSEIQMHLQSQTMPFMTVCTLHCIKL